jgi:hypothetical protein
MKAHYPVAAAGEDFDDVTAHESRTAQYQDVHAARAPILA